MEDNERIKKVMAVASEVTYCAYCNEGVFREDDETAIDKIRDHIKNVCPLHPMREVERQRDAAADVLEDARVFIRNLPQQRAPNLYKGRLNMLIKIGEAIYKARRD